MLVRVVEHLIKESPTLRILSLNNNQLTDEGFAYLASRLQSFTDIRVLYLSKLC